MLTVSSQMSQWCRLTAVGSIICAAVFCSPAMGDESSAAYSKQALPLIRTFCFECHSTKESQGELDLERFQSTGDIADDVKPWQHVVHMLDTGEMPPERATQPTAAQRKELRDWVQNFLDSEALRNAGDPGPVVLRRLNNAEYTYSIQDLTGVALTPTEQFPVDSAAGEGFTNVGDALVMSPSMVQKYLDAAKDVAAHAVLLPDGIRFSESTTRRDWSNQIVDDIRRLYSKGTSGASQTSQLDGWSGDPNSSTANDGRVDLVPYFAAVIQHKAKLIDPDFARGVAEKKRINGKYLNIIARSVFDDAASALLADIRMRVERSAPKDAASIVKVVKAWQDRLWKFNAVGHLGLVIPWQDVTTPVEPVRHFRIPLTAGQSQNVAVHLAARRVSGDDETVSTEWSNPRIERKHGCSPIDLKDVRAISVVWPEFKKTVIEDFSKYLAAIRTIRDSRGKGNDAAIARKYAINPVVLNSLSSWLGIGSSSEPEIAEYLDKPLNRVGSYESVTGWGLEGADALSVLGNSSDNQVQIPGDMRGHRIATHPMPDRFSAVGWKSPIAGKVSVAAFVQHAHDACGNGVSYKVELWRGAERRVLLSDNVDKGGKAKIDPLRNFLVQRNDLLSLIIGPRDNSHVCDLTEIDLVITEENDAQRGWSLSADCADSMAAGNPHADSFGNSGIWHFYTGLLTGVEKTNVVPQNSMLAKWLDAADKSEADRLADQLQSLVNKPLSKNVSPDDAQIYRLLHSVNGPLFSAVDFAELAKTATPDSVAESVFGLTEEVGTGNNLIVEGNADVKILLPADLVDGCEFVVSARTDDAACGQLFAGADPPPSELLMPGEVVVASTEVARKQAEKAFDEFREIFPAAMCHARIVPVDEVVTLLLYHREDGMLSRLMLDQTDKAELDRLWKELRFVSQDALRLEVALEQILEFSTQDADPRRFDPVLKPIADGAEAFRKWQLDTEKTHVDAVVEFARRAYRRALTKDEEHRFRDLYRGIRTSEIGHEGAIRLLIARSLSSPEFLYRLEEAGPAKTPVKVSTSELATRLSYFLWSSMPDTELRKAATEEYEVLLQQTRRMLRDPRARRMAVEFGCQWLHIREFDKDEGKNENEFPEFKLLRGDMYEESIRCWEELIRSDGSVLDLIDADHTFVNPRLAKHYGIAEVTDGWHRVDGVRQHGRGGILTQASNLARQSGASRTSPILRGTWVSETLLGERLPRPPQNVPELPERLPIGLSARQLVERHTADEACAKCHRKIDPYGFALENYDAIGRFRRVDDSRKNIDAETQLPDGTTLNGVDGLKKYLLTTRREDFLRQFCRKLVGYALGRSVQLSDEPLLAEMREQLQKNDYRFSTAVETIVTSPQFQMIRGRQQ